MRQKTRNIEVVEEREITQKIITIRGQKVLLDSDLARLYGISTTRLNEQVKRNQKRFPPDFMFKIDTQEYGALRSQNAILKRGQHKKYMPRVFTEYGIAMLSSVLNSERAIQMNIQIIRIFIRLRGIMAQTMDIQKQLKLLEHQSAGHKMRIDIALDAIGFLLDKTKQSD